LCGLVGVLWGARFGTVDAVIAPRSAELLAVAG
jgi:hypothetical protein